MPESQNSHDQHEQQLDALIAEYYRAEAAGKAPDHNEFIAQHPEFAKELAEFFADLGFLWPATPEPILLAATYITSIAIGVRQTGRYRLDRVLGQGAFGIVYLGYDEELQRQVAIKVPTKERFQKPEDAEAYLAEARMVASLDDPHIVPVYDVGRTQDSSIYVVSKFIEGRTLADRIEAGPLTDRESAQLLSMVARALQHAHDRRLIHRDVKPANILLEDKSNAPYVADFGLAIREEDYLKQTAIAGTPSYMSPEQARGEGHRLDGRSDIFSMGVILYELLTGRKAFRGSSPLETLHQVVSLELKPPREVRDTIPPELERICLKALSKLTTDRYATAAEFADDLEQWLKPTASAIPTKAPVQVVPRGLRSFDAGDAGFFLDLLPGPRNRDGLPESIAFWKQRIEQTDPEQTFNVGLLYGPSGCGKSSLVKAGLLPHLSDGVIAVYVEATPEDTETRILRGLKKLLVVVPGSTRHDVRSRIHENSDESRRDRSLTTSATGLAETLTALRRGQGRKVVIVIDQFEQWLHAHRPESDAELVKALRQCDGGRLQAIVMLRDDFSMAASRFMRSLDTRIVEGHNFATVDLFEVSHAAKVLRKFGQSFGKLPANTDDLSADERQFVNDVADGLAQEGKVVSVRLSLFADIIRKKSWTAATLKQVGGTEGIGINFLEETFSSLQANPDHRLHAVAARRVLRALLPDLGTDIRGHMRSHAELLAVSGYPDQPSNFAELLRILDTELRLITPTDPEGKDEGGRMKDELRESANSSFIPHHSSLIPHPSSFGYFQLTHDYLVPFLREWLTRKQKETRRGRAELKLAERAALWTARPENRHLPSLLEWLRIRWLTQPQKWTEQQRVMMNRAGGFHLFRSTTVAAVAALIVTGGLWTWSRVEQSRRELLAQKITEQEETRIEGLVGRLVSAEPDQLPGIVKELDANPEVAATFLLPLVSSNSATADERRARLHAQLAVVSRDSSLLEPLTEELLANKVTYVGPIRQQLRPFAAQLTQKLQEILRNQRADTDRRFRSALALAEYIPISDEAAWTEQDLQFVARQLVASNAEFQPLLREHLRPIHLRLLGHLETIFADPGASDGQRLSAANAFSDYAASDIPKLSQLLTVATPEQYGVLYPIVASGIAPAARDVLTQLAAKLPPDELGSVERVPYGQQRANAAVTLLRLGERQTVLPVFEMTDDPEAMTQFIFRCRDRGVRVEELLDCLRIVSGGPFDRYPPNTRYALLLALGEYALDEIPETRQASLLTQLGDWYRNDPSSGVHGAAGWLLRKWGQAEIVRAVDKTPVSYSVDREWFTLAITVTPTSPPNPTEKPADENAAPEAEAITATPADGAASRDEGTEKKDESDSTEPAKDEAKPEPPPELLSPRTFYYTFIVLPCGESMIGSVEDEPERSLEDDHERRHMVNLTRPFALLDREVTFEELIAFSPHHTGMMQRFKAQPSDAGFAPHWYDSVSFCRWLSQQSGLSESDQSYADPKLLDQAQYPRDPVPHANGAPRDWPLEWDRRGFRLPTESEWEVACRAGARTAYGYGSDVALLDQFGWFQENSSKHVHPPRELRPTVRGVFDLHGNLYEWTHDWYGSFGEAAEIDPLGARAGFARVLRGGSWSHVAASCRTAWRNRLVPSDSSNLHGFRLALSCPSGDSPEAEEGAEPADGGPEGVRR